VGLFFPRRDFLGMALAFAVPPDLFPTDVRHRLAVSTYPFRAVITRSDEEKTNPSQLTLMQFADSIVGRFNVYGIEPWSAHFNSLEPTYLRDLRTSFMHAGVRVVNIPCDVRVSPCASAAQQDAAQDTWHQWVGAAVTVGSPSIRVHAPRGTSPGDISCAVSTLSALASYGASQKIVINLENDDPAAEDPERIVRIIEAVGSSYLRALPDFCNSMQIHDDPAYNERALAALFPHAFNISHVKDVEIVRGKTLRVNVGRLFAIARNAGYRGFFSMETEGSLNPHEGTRLLIEAAIKALSPPR
jgi:sugar phosphate isomerase/epimerase